MRYAIQVTGGLDKSRKESSDSHKLMVTSESLELHGLKSLTYSRKMYSYDSYDDVSHQYEIEFYDPALAQRFYQQVASATSQYCEHCPVAAPTYDGSKIRTNRFPVFMAAFVILAADSRYEAPRDGLAAFRIEAPLSALPEMSLVEQNVNPGALAPPSRGERFWEMSSVLSARMKAAATLQSAPRTSTAALLANSVFALQPQARRIDPEFDQDQFLRLFTDNEELLRNARFVDVYVDSNFEFPPTTNRDILVSLSQKLAAAGFRNEIRAPIIDPIFSRMFPPTYTINISAKKAVLITFLERQKQARPQSISVASMD